MATLASGRRGGSSPGTTPEWGISNRSAREMMAEIERLRAGYEAIKKATTEGRVCDDVAWFDTITTLYDFCDEMLCHEQEARDVK